MRGITALLKSAQSALLFLCQVDTVKRRPSMKQEADPHQTPDLPVPPYGAARPPERWKATVG